MLIFGADREIASWVGSQVGIRDFGPSTAIGVARANKVVAGAVFHNFNWPNIEVSFASTTPLWCTHQTITSILKYPFVQLDCRRLTAITKATNQPARAFLCRLGFEIEGFHPEMFADGDVISLGLLRRKCRWIAEEFRFGQERANPTSST
jgi:RimJ/RimL family protein N-acetyltransferase